MKINSDIMKVVLMNYFRFQRKYLCSLECCISRLYYADVMVYTGRDLIELEIKISKSDLYSEIKNKLWKHISYDKLLLDVPNQFYICVPKYLKMDALVVAKKLNIKYGVIVVNVDKEIQDINYLLNSGYNDCVRVAKRASYLHKDENLDLSYEMAKNMTGKYINLFLKNIKRDYKREEKNKEKRNIRR